MSDCQPSKEAGNEVTVKLSKNETKIPLIEQESFCNISKATYRKIRTSSTRFIFHRSSYTNWKYETTISSDIQYCIYKFF